MKKNYPNPFRKENIFLLILKEKSNVTIELFDENGVKIFTILEGQELLKGKQEIKFNGNQLKSGIYKAKICIENSHEIRLEDSSIKIN